MKLNECHHVWAICNFACQRLLSNILKCMGGTESLHCWWEAALHEWNNHQQKKKTFKPWLSWMVTKACGQPLSSSHSSELQAQESPQTQKQASWRLQALQLFSSGNSHAGRRQGKWKNLSHRAQVGEACMNVSSMSIIFTSEYRNY